MGPISIRIYSLSFIVSSELQQDEQFMPDNSWQKCSKLAGELSLLRCVMCLTMLNSSVR